MYILDMPVVLPLFWLILSFANPTQAATQQASNTFEQIAKQADQARTTEHLNDAIALYSRGVRLRPAWNEGWWWLGSLLYDQDRFAEAQQAFAHFVKLNPRPGPAYAFLALCEYENRQYDRALLDFQMWAKKGSPGNDALLDVAGYHWATLLTRKGEFPQALYLLSAKAKKLGPTPAIIEALGLASLRKSALPEEYPPRDRESVWLAGMASYYAVQQDFRRASEFSQRLLAHYADKPNVHYFRGTLLRFQGKLAPAVGEFRRELEISPRHSAALTELAVCLFDGGEAAEALTPAKRATVLEPGNARAHYTLGKALSQIGSYQESAHELEIAKKLAPDSAGVRFVLATVYKRLGRSKDYDRELAAFQALQGKEEVLAPLDEKFKSPTKSDTSP